MPAPQDVLCAILLGSSIVVPNGLPVLTQSGPIHNQLLPPQGSYGANHALALGENGPYWELHSITCDPYSHAEFLTPDAERLD
jgi:hypothetical protein